MKRVAVRIVMIGPPGAGKGTQARRLERREDVPQISTGEMLRDAEAAGTELGRAAARYMLAGQLVPDNVVIGIVEERLAAPVAALKAAGLRIERVVADGDWRTLVVRS